MCASDAVHAVVQASVVFLYLRNQTVQVQAAKVELCFMFPVLFSNYFVFQTQIFHKFKCVYLEIIFSDI